MILNILKVVKNNFKIIKLTIIILFGIIIIFMLFNFKGCDPGETYGEAKEKISVSEKIRNILKKESEDLKNEREDLENSLTDN